MSYGQRYESLLKNIRKVLREVLREELAEEAGELARTIGGGMSTRFVRLSGYLVFTENGWLFTDDPSKFEEKPVTVLSWIETSETLKSRSWTEAVQSPPFPVAYIRGRGAQLKLGVRTTGAASFTLTKIGILRFKDYTHYRGFVPIYKLAVNYTTTSTTFEYLTLRNYYYYYREEAMGLSGNSFVEVSISGYTSDSSVPGEVALVTGKTFIEVEVWVPEALLEVL